MPTGPVWRTEQTYREWAARFATYLGNRSPYAAAGAEVTAFLSVLAVEQRASFSTQRQASVETTQIYTHVMRKPGLGVRSPLDALRAGPFDAAIPGPGNL